MLKEAAEKGGGNFLVFVVFSTKTRNIAVTSKKEALLEYGEKM